MMNREELVRAAIAFESPQRIPVWNINRDTLHGDVVHYGLGLDTGGGNEWGYRLVQLDDGTIGHPGDPLLPDWDAVRRHPDPLFRKADRLAGVREFVEQSGDRYRLGSLGISGFNVYLFLRGFENAVTDFLVYPEEAAALTDRIFGFETRLIEVAAEAGMHGIHFADDWGTQSGLMIAPDLWRSFYKGRYRAQFARAHELGLQVWFHSCGNILDIIEDFHDIGVDVMNISQPNVVDMEEVGRRWKGKQCFLLPISYQTVSISGTPEAILAEARRLYDLMSVPEGGMVGYVEEYGCMGMSEENYQACNRAFRVLSV